MKKFKLTALLLSMAMMLSVFAGCGSKGEALVTIDGKGIQGYMFEYFVQSMANSYASQGMNLADYLDQDTGDGTTVEDLLKNQVIETMKTYVACEKLAEDNGLALTDEEIKQIDETKKKQIEEAGGRKEFVKQLEQAKIQEEAIDEMNRYGAIYEKVYNGLFGQNGKFAPSTEEIIAGVIPANARVKHVLIQATKDSEDYEAKKQTAQQVQARAAAGEDFDALIAEFNEDPGMDTYLQGYIFDANGTNYDGSGTMDSAFASAAHALEVNGVSPIVETSYGFHIIKRLPLDEAYINENLGTFYDSAAYEVFNAKVTEIAAELTVVKTDAYEEFSIAKLLGAESHEGHDHATTGTLEPEVDDADDAADDVNTADTADTADTAAE